MPRQTKRFVRAERSDLQRLNWQFQVINRAGWRREVPDIIHRAIEKNKPGHILLDEPKAPVASQVRDVVNAASDQIVHGNDFMGPFQQQVHQMRAEKPRAAGYHRGGLLVPGFAFLRVALIKRHEPSRFVTVVGFRTESVRLTWRPFRAKQPESSGREFSSQATTTSYRCIPNPAAPNR